MEQNESLEKKPLSFGFSKRQEKTQLGTSAVKEHEEKIDDSKDFVLSMESNKVKSTKPVHSNTPKEYVIPLIKQNKWRLNSADEGKPSGDQESLDLIAAKEILQESARLNDDWAEKGTVDSSKSIPLLMQNKVPGGFETDSSLNVDLRPEEPKDADYDEIPIEQFGMALLRGMGWKEGKGIGKNAKMIAPVEAQLRPKGLGLGADKTNTQGKEKSSHSLKSKDSEESLELKKGAFCIVVNGPNKDLYGTIEGIDEDNARTMVKLSLSGKVVNLMQCNISLVSKKDFEKHSKYLNKLKVDKYKKDESERKKSSRNNKESNSRKRDYHNSDEERNGELDTHSREHKNHSHHREKRSRDNFREEPQKHKHSKYSLDDRCEEKHEKHRHKHKKHHKKHKNKRSPGDSYSSSEDAPTESETQHPWLRKDLRVRIIDKNLKGGKYYKEKVIIEDVLCPGYCVCKTVDGKVLDNVSQSSLETVVPRTDGTVVSIVSGSHCSQLGEIMKRDKEKCLALVQMLSDRDIVLKVQYDEICEYVGDVHFME